MDFLRSCDAEGRTVLGIRDILVQIRIRFRVQLRIRLRIQLRIRLLSSLILRMQKNIF